MKKIVVIFVAVCIALYAFSHVGNGTSIPDGPALPTIRTSAADRAEESNKKATIQAELKRLEPKQADREKIIQSMMAEGMIEHVEVQGTIGYLTVAPRFLLLKFDDKKTIADLAFAWCRCKQLQSGGDCDAVIIQDSTNHHKIGKYSKYTGFTLE